jgi:hypothetical protein
MIRIKLSLSIWQMRTTSYVGLVSHDYIAEIKLMLIVTADSAIMHPKEKIIALKCANAPMSLLCTDDN